MTLFLTVITLVVLLIFLYMQLPQFGAHPSGERLARVKKSQHYKDGKFSNLDEKPILTKGHTIIGELYARVFKEHPRKQPADTLPSRYTDLKNIAITDNVYVWFGHSSFYIQLNGKKILMDPVFSGAASPLPGSVKAYKGSNIYTADDLPEIDYLLISHDHYDHLDYETIVALKDKVKHVICGLGIGAHFERWGYSPDQIIEKDWGENIVVDNDLAIYTESTHHNTGRGFVRNKSLWVAYLLRTPDLKIYISGDGGYDGRFTEIEKKHGPVDWAIMECGQYNTAWQSVHNLPEQVVKATLQLKAKNLIPVHHSKFTLANHPWDEPLVQMTEMAVDKPYRLVTPLIGEPVNLNSQDQTFKRWWETVK